MDSQQEENLHKAGQWFLYSGIQSPDGGVARYYHGDDRRNLPVSTEITGYTASAYAYLYRRMADPRFCEAAETTAKFLVNSAWDPHAATFPFETNPGSPAYFFDCGIIIRGLLAVWNIHPLHELREIVSLAAHSMASDFVDGSTIHPIIDLPSKVPCPHEKRWSREPGCFQLKAALAWRALGDPRLDEYWRIALDAALANHACFLPGSLNEEQVMDRLHAYCYFLEGLIADPASAAVLQQGIERTAHYLRAIRPRFVRSDVCGQLLRLRLFAETMGIPIHIGQAEEEARWIEGFAIPSDDPALDGAYSFGRRAGDLLRIANPVSTAFCMQALDYWHQYTGGSFKSDLASLI
jgi:hypothetical protein